MTTYKPISTTIDASDQDYPSQPGVERQKWRKTGIGYKRFFPGIHWTLFYLVLKYYHNEKPNEEHRQKGPFGYIKESGQETGLGLGGPRGAVRTEETRDQGDTIVGMRDYRHGENTEQRYRHCLSGHRPDNQAYQQLCADSIVRDKALADLTAMVREYGTPPATTQPYGPPKILHNKERNAGVGFDVYTVLFILTRR